MKLRELLNTAYKDQVLSICLDRSSRVNSRRDNLARFIKLHELDVVFNVSELRDVIEEFQDYVCTGAVKGSRSTEAPFGRFSCKDKVQT